MMRSHNEVVGMAVKAARGAGIPLGHAEEFGPAFAHLACAHSEALPNVLDVLAQPHGDVAANFEEDALKIANGQTIMCGPIVRDAILAGTKTVTVSDIDLPELLAAYCAVSGGMEIVLGATCIIQAAPIAAEAAGVGPVSVPENVWTGLNTLAALTYVPASDASRLAGAGAGLTDND